MRPYWACPCLLLLGVASLLHAAPDQREIEARALADVLSTGGTARVDAAISQIVTALESDPGRSVGYLRRFWLKPLQENHREDAVIKLTMQGILAAPWQTGDVEYLLESRIRALLHERQWDEALMNAKSLFNVSSLRNANRSLLLIDECLRRSQPGQAQLYKQLHKEQIQGATTMPERTTNPIQSTVVKGIRVNAEVYIWRINLITSNDDRSQIAKGNLHLLADQPKEAHEIFDRLVATTESTKLLPFYEHIARTIKAEDGTIGRANGTAMDAPDDN